jgi:hypothetical protein
VSINSQQTAEERAQDQVYLAVPDMVGCSCLDQSVAAQETWRLGLYLFARTLTEGVKHVIHNYWMLRESNAIAPLDHRPIE